MRRLRLLLPLLALPLAAPVGAETLADIRVELGQLAADFNALKAELTTTGSMASVGGGDALSLCGFGFRLFLVKLGRVSRDLALRLGNCLETLDLKRGFLRHPTTLGLGQFGDEGLVIALDAGPVLQHGGDLRGGRFAVRS